MEIVKAKSKKNVIKKTWERCKSTGTSSKKSETKPDTPLPKSKSWQCTTKPSEAGNCKTKRKVAPAGCFSVYVGPQKQRFVIKTEFVNHPLFKTLLEDAELEYGYSSEGPITLPCDVDLFYKVLAEIESGDEISTPAGCNSFAMGYGSFSPFLSPHRPSYGGRTVKSYGPYSLLSPSRMLKMNQF